MNAAQVTSLQDTATAATGTMWADPLTCGTNVAEELVAKAATKEGGFSAMDIEQDFDSIAPYTIEEAYEVADAIERRDWPELEGELGDLLHEVLELNKRLPLLDTGVFEGLMLPHHHAGVGLLPGHTGLP